MRTALVLICLTAVAARAQVAGQAAPAQLVLDQGRGEPIDLSADRGELSIATGKLMLSGHVVAHQGSTWLRAGSGTYDRQARTLDLSGGVLLVRGGEVALAQGAHADLGDRAVDLAQAVLLIKEGSLPSTELTLAQARAAGTNRFLLSGRRIRMLSAGRYQIEGVWLTPCDCADPDFALTSDSVTVADQRARLAAPHLLLFGASVPLLVPVVLPLSHRASGLLFPELRASPTTGFSPLLPLYLTLGRSADATVGLGAFTAGHSGATGRGVRGPRLDLTLRAAEAVGSTSELHLELLRDLDASDSPGQASAASPGEVPSAPGRGWGGTRGLLRVNHRSEWSGGAAALDGALASDARVLSDVRPTADLARYLDALRTDAGAWTSGETGTLGLSATLLQDLRAPEGDRRLFGAEARRTFQRLPAAFAFLAPQRRGPLSWSAEASVASFVPFGPASAEEAATGFGPADRAEALPQPLPPADGQGQARSAALRADLAPRVALDLFDEGPLLVRAYAGGRGDLWHLPGAPGRDRQRLYALAGAVSSLGLSRSYSGALLHEVWPELEVRALSPHLQGGGAPLGDPFDRGGASFAADPWASQAGVDPGTPLRPELGTANALGIPAARRPDDEVDAAAPEAGEIQAALRLRQSLFARGPAGHAVRLARLELSQGAVLLAPPGSSGRRTRWSQSASSAELTLPGFTLRARGSYDWSSRSLDELSASARVPFSGPLMPELHGGFLLLEGAQSASLRAGIDELFSGARLAGQTGRTSGNLTAGGALQLPFARRVRLGLDTTRWLAITDPNVHDWEHRATLGYASPCGCMSLRLGVGVLTHGPHRLGAPEIFFGLILKSLGSFETM